MPNFVPPELRGERFYRRLSHEDRSILLHAFWFPSDLWGRLLLDIEGLADRVGVDDDRVAKLMLGMFEARLMLPYEHNGVAYAQLTCHDAWASSSFMATRNLPKYPAPPLPIWEAAQCTRRCQNVVKGRMPLDGPPMPPSERYREVAEAESKATRHQFLGDRHGLERLLDTLGVHDPRRRDVLVIDPGTPQRNSRELPKGTPGNSYPEHTPGTPGSSPKELPGVPGMEGGPPATAPTSQAGTDSPESGRGSSRELPMGSPGSDYTSIGGLEDRGSKSGGSEFREDDDEKTRPASAEGPSPEAREPEVRGERPETSTGEVSAGQCRSVQDREAEALGKCREVFGTRARAVARFCEASADARAQDGDTVAWVDVLEESGDILAELAASLGVEAFEAMESITEGRADGLRNVGVSLGRFVEGRARQRRKHAERDRPVRRRKELHVPDARGGPPPPDEEPGFAELLAESVALGRSFLAQDPPNLSKARDQLRFARVDFDELVAAEWVDEGVVDRALAAIEAFEAEIDAATPLRAVGDA